MSKRSNAPTGTPTRRQFIASVGASLGALALPVSALARRTNAPRPAAFEINGTPDRVTIFCGLSSPMELTLHAEEWRSGDSAVRLHADEAATAILLSAPSIEPTHVRLRWRGSTPADATILGDAWERSYGDLAWEPCRPERCLPWYCAVHSARTTTAYGVLCNASAFAFWQIDPEGITLWLDICNGGSGVRLGDRVLHAASILCVQGDEDESAYGVLSRFCGLLSRRPRHFRGPLLGTNDWYYAYGKNTASGIERDADFIASLMPSRAPKAFTIIDDGWTNASAFPDMHALAESLRGRGVRPGIWVRPLQAKRSTPGNLLLPASRYGSRLQRYGDLAFDPTIPEALAIILAKIKQAVAWGYELVKHDFSTYELFGQWGNEMGALVTLPGWRFHDASRTNAEIVQQLYWDIRESTGEDTCIIGCNTIGHLAAGCFEANRTGDDVSGRQWERTRRMGVNTLAFRSPQNRRFFVQDPDCVPLTRAIDWRMTSQWLDLVARSGTALIVSAEHDAITAEHRDAVRDALQSALTASSAEPLDWMEDTTPERWRFRATAAQEFQYDWNGPEGSSPFPLN